MGLQTIKPHRSAYSYLAHDAAYCCICSVVYLCVSVCVSVCSHERELCRNGRTDRDAIWDIDYWSPKNHVSDGTRIPPRKRHFCGIVLWHARTCRRSIFSTLFARGSSDTASDYHYTGDFFTYSVAYLCCGFSDIKAYFENTYDIDESLFTSLAGMYRHANT